MRKNQKVTNIFFTFSFLRRKIYILLENIFGKTSFMMLNLYYSFLAWQVFGSAVTKRQRAYRCALVLQTSYFDPKYLAIDYVLDCL